MTFDLYSYLIGVLAMLPSLYYFVKWQVPLAYVPGMRLRDSLLTLCMAIIWPVMVLCMIVLFVKDILPGENDAF